MWEWYTGVINWKTQTPWTSMSGQIYDYYLNQNAGLQGLKHESKSLHIFFDHTKDHVMIANNTFKSQIDLMIRVNVFDMNGEKTLIYQEIVSTLPICSKRHGSTGRKLEEISKKEGVFLHMKLINNLQHLIPENFYWLADDTGEHTGMQKLRVAELKANATLISKDIIKVKLNNPFPDSPASFFNRISVFDSKTGLRSLVVYYSENYFRFCIGKRN